MKIEDQLQPGLFYRLFKSGLAFVLRILYRVEVQGLEHLAEAGPRHVIVVNHVSFLDPALLVAFLPGRPIFPINTYTARWWWVRPLLALARTYKLDPLNPMSTKTLIKLVQEGNSCVIFPEGRLTVTGGLMKIYEGPGMVADRAKAMLIPLRIDGAQFTYFSHLKGKLRLRWFPKITITIQPPCTFKIPPEIKGRERRRRSGLALYDVMSDMMFDTTNHERTLFKALLDARHVNGGAKKVLEDPERQMMSYDKLVLAALVLGRRLSKLANTGDAVGILLPNVSAAAVTFFSLQAFGRVPAMLNFASGISNIEAACQIASLRVLLTSSRFVEQGHFEELIKTLQNRVTVIYLEDIKAKITFADKLYGLLSRPFAARIHRKIGRKPQHSAVILFTSGSEGAPKGVVLSHRSIIANCDQLAARISFTPVDVVFNALPIFHSFGMIALLLPILNGLRTFLYPSPLHYRIVPELAYDTNSTVMFGTDTFLAGYARAASAYDFYNVRYVVAGGEKVKDETRTVWMEKFGHRILEGYGATEMSPVMAINTPMHYKVGTVGRLLPRITYRLEPVEGVSEGGRLFVHGPTVMTGYLRAEHPGVLEPPADGWYDTGDIVTIDDLGFVTIIGRAKRFAKIAGEMISLGRVEAEISSLWPETKHAVVAIGDARKGEQLVLLTERKEIDRNELLAKLKGKGFSDLMVPRTIQYHDKLPLLGGGKIDYGAVQKLVEK